MSLQRKNERKRVANVRAIEEVWGHWVILYWQETQIQSQHEASGDTERRRRADGQKHPPAARALHAAKRSRPEVTSKTGPPSLRLFLHTLFISYEERTNSPPLHCFWLQVKEPSPVLQKGIPTSWCRRKSQISQCFPKEAQHRTPLPHPPLLLWCERNGSQSRKSSCQPQRTHSFLHTGTQSLQISVLAYFVLPLYPHIKPADALTLKEPAQAPICLSHSPSAVWAAVYIWKLLSDISDGQVLIPACEVCVNLRLSLPPFNALWFCSTWLVDNKEQVAVKGSPPSCLFLILFVSFVYH